MRPLAPLLALSLLVGLYSARYLTEPHYYLAGLAIAAVMLFVLLLGFAKADNIPVAGRIVGPFFYASLLLLLEGYTAARPQAHSAGYPVPAIPAWSGLALLALFAPFYLAQIRWERNTLEPRMPPPPEPLMPPPPGPLMLAPHPLRLNVAERTDTGEPWYLDLSSALHTLFAGASGAGKGSGAWSVITALEEPVKAGLVRLVLFDPKKGMELSAAAGMAEVFCYQKKSEDLDEFSERVVEVLENEVRLMGLRANELMRLRQRKVTPSQHHPVTVMLFDELASMNGLPDRQLQKRADKAMATLLEQGRAPGWFLLALTQDASQETVGSHIGRLFTNRVCLRVNAKADVDVVLRSPGARTAGARADLIKPKIEAGVAYVMNDAPAYDAEGEIVDRFLRIRFRWVSDDDLDRLRGRWPAAWLDAELGEAPEPAEPAEPADEPAEPAESAKTLRDKLAEAWPGETPQLHLDEVADLLGLEFVTEDELVEAGIAVVSGVQRRRTIDGKSVRKRALGVYRDSI